MSGIGRMPAERRRVGLAGWPDDAAETDRLLCCEHDHKGRRGAPVHEQCPDRREETYVLLAQLMYMHKLIFEESIPRAWKQKGKTLHDVLNLKVSKEEEEACKDESAELRLEEEKGSSKVAQFRKMLAALQDLQDFARSEYGTPLHDSLGELSKPLALREDSFEALRGKARDRLFHVWDQLPIMGIDQILGRCGESAPVFVSSLCLRVPEDELRGCERLWQCESRWCAGLVVPMNVGLWQVAGDWNDLKEEGKGLDEIAPRSSYSKEPCSRWGAGFGLAEYRHIATELFYTTCGQLLSAPNEDRADDGMDHVYFTATLLRSSARGLFATPLGYANIQRSWCKAFFPYFVIHRCMDALFQLTFCVAIVPHSHRSHSDAPSWPEPWGLHLALLLGFRGILTLSIEIAMWVCKERKRKLIGPVYFNAFTMYCVVVEAWCFAFTCALWNDYYVNAPDPLSEIAIERHIRATILYRHPVMLCCLLLAKWLQLMLQLMSVDCLLNPLLPAWHAIKSRSSITVLLTFSALCVGTANGYYALPVTGNHKEGFIGALYLMFRLDMMGDFDQGELERGTTAGPDEPVKEMHYALEGFTILCGLMFTVTLLNVYIGLLSSEYERSRGNLMDNMGRFRAAPSVRLDLYRRFWKPCCGCCMRKKGMGTEKGYWILLPKDFTKDYDVDWESWSFPHGRPCDGQ